MTELTTSATKLYNILKEFKEFKEADDTTVVWGKILGAKNIQDPLEVSSKLSQLFVLCNEARLDIKAIKNINNKIYLNAIDKIQFLLFNKPLLGTELSLIQSAISSDTLDIIAASGDLIKQSRLYKEIDKNQLEELKVKIGFLQDEIKEAKIEKDLKNLLEQQLNKLKDAIETYPIRGSSALDNTIKAILGEVCLNLGQVSKKGREITISFIQFLLIIDAYISLENKFQQLPKFLERILPI